MATKVFNVSGGMYSGAAFSAFESRMYGSAVASADSMKVTAGAGTNLSISAGDIIIANNSDFGYRAQLTSATTVSTPAVPTVSGYSRYDAIVAYIDLSVTPDTSKVDNINAGILKFKSVSGTAGTNPTTTSADNNIASSIGAANPYVVLAYVLVPANATAATSFTITDNRKVAKVDLVISTTDIGEGAPLPTGTLYGVYEE